MLRALHYHPLTGVMTAILFVLLATACRNDDDTLQGQSELKTLTIHFTDPNDISQRTSHREVIYVSRQSGELLFCTEFDDVKTEVYEFDGQVGEKFNVWVAWIDLAPPANVDHAQVIDVVGYMERSIDANEEWSFTGVLQPRSIEHDILRVLLNTNGEEVKNVSVRTSLSTQFRASAPGLGMPFEIESAANAEGDIIYVVGQNANDQWMHKRVSYGAGNASIIELDFSEFETSTIVDAPMLPVNDNSSIHIYGFMDDFMETDPIPRWGVRSFDDQEFPRINLMDSGFDHYLTSVSLKRSGETHYLSFTADHLPTAFDFEDFTLDFTAGPSNQISFQSDQYGAFVASWGGPESQEQHPTHINLNLAGRIGVNYHLPELPACVLDYSSDQIETADLILRSGGVQNYNIFEERTMRFERLFKGADDPDELHQHYAEERIRRFKSF